MKLTKQGKSYQIEYNGTHYYRMSFSETSIGSWFQISNDRYIQVDDVNLIMELEHQFNILELDNPTKVENISAEEENETNETNI